MLFWASCEVFEPAYAAIERVRRGLEPSINDFISQSVVAALDCKFRYVPIIMPEGARDHYPARSKLRKKDRICDCAPQLDYETFVSGTLEQQAREYVRGITTMVARLADLGASVDQIAHFERILARSVERFLESQAGPAIR